MEYPFIGRVNHERGYTMITGRFFLSIICTVLLGAALAGTAPASDSGPAAAGGIGKLADERDWFREDGGYAVRNVRGNKEFAPTLREAGTQESDAARASPPDGQADIYPDQGRETGR